MKIREKEKHYIVANYLTLMRPRNNISKQARFHTLEFTLKILIGRL